MKVFELAQELKFKAPDILSKAKELGFETRAISSNLSDEEAIAIRVALEGVKPTKVFKESKVDLEGIPHDMKKGALLGITFDGDKFVIVSCRLSIDQVKKYEHEIISEHNSLNGAIIEIQKNVPKQININTVKSFKKE